jgi:hypothetical protein
MGAEPGVSPIKSRTLRLIAATAAKANRHRADLYRSGGFGAEVTRLTKGASSLERKAPLALRQPPVDARDLRLAMRPSEVEDLANRSTRVWRYNVVDPQRTQRQYFDPHARVKMHEGVIVTEDRVARTADVTLGVPNLGVAGQKRLVDQLKQSHPFVRELRSIRLGRLRPLRLRVRRMLPGEDFPGQY